MLKAVELVMAFEGAFGIEVLVSLEPFGGNL
jgi:acyl carrier protein